MTDYPEGLSLIVPCYNEEGSIAQTLEAARRALAQLNVPTEILVVDDGSQDRSAEQVDTQRFRLIRNPENQGYGAALRAGAREARYNAIAIADADGTYPLERLPALYEALAEADMAIGARTGKSVRIPLARRPAKWAIGRLATYLTGCKIPDLNSGLRVVRREVWERYERYYPDGFSLTTTITLASLVNGHAVRFIPIDYSARVGHSKIRPVRDTLNFVQLILRTVLYFNPLKVFVPASLASALTGLLVGVTTLTLEKCFGIGRFMDVTTVLLFLTGVQLMAIGGLADLITKRMR